jgi:hypothetical protein
MGRSMFGVRPAVGGRNSRPGRYIRGGTIPLTQERRAEMANNRMFVVNDRLKLKMCIAKYMPTGGWGSYDPEMDQNLNTLFDVDYRNVSGFDVNEGSTDWRLSFESADEWSIGGRCVDYQFPGGDS